MNPLAWVDACQELGPGSDGLPNAVKELSFDLCSTVFWFQVRGCTIPGQPAARALEAPVVPRLRMRLRLRAWEWVFRSPDKGSSGHDGDIPPPPAWLYDDLDAPPAEEPWAEAPAPFPAQEPLHTGIRQEEGFALEEGEPDPPAALDPDAGVEAGAWSLSAPEEGESPPPTAYPPDPPGMFRHRSEAFHDPPTEDFYPEAPEESTFEDPHPALPAGNGLPPYPSASPDTLPTRLDNPVHQDIYATEEPTAHKEVDGDEAERPDLEAQFSDPSFSQPSVGQLEPRSRESGTVPLYTHLGSELVGADPESGVPLGRAETVLGSEDNGRQAGHDRLPPREVSRPSEADSSVLGWRVAGVSWLIFSAMMIIPFLKAGVGTTTAVIFAPLIIGGLALLTGWRWIGLTALGVTTLYSMFFGFLGYLLVFDIQTLAVFGEISHLPAEYGIGMMVVGATFLFSNAMLLVAAPEMSRAILGALISLLPALGALGFFLTADTKPQLRGPLSSFAAAGFHSPEGGFRFEKPAGWTVYSWEEILDTSRLGRGLVTEPDFYFVDERQDLLFTIYLRELPRRSLADLLGGAPRTALELEVIRGLPMKDAPPEEFTFKDTNIVFTETIHEGTLDDGTRLSIIIDRAELPNKLLLVVMTRDLQSATTAEEAERQLNEFYRNFEFVR